jgi:hypothetical protein
MSDGYSIDRTVYPTKEAAQSAMKHEYAELNNNEPDDEWDIQSSIDDMNAALYDRGDNVYLWAIYPL